MLQTRSRPLLAASLLRLPMTAGCTSCPFHFPQRLGCLNSSFHLRAQVHVTPSCGRCRRNQLPLQPRVSLPPPSQAPPLHFHALLLKQRLLLKPRLLLKQRLLLKERLLLKPRRGLLALWSCWSGWTCRSTSQSSCEEWGRGGGSHAHVDRIARPSSHFKVVTGAFQEGKNHGQSGYGLGPDAG